MKLFFYENENNKGFTLVEVLTAMVILAIVTVPLLNAFVVSARTNTKAKAAMNAVNVGQNIIEGLEANTVEEIAYQFNYPNNIYDPDDNKNNPIEFNILAKKNEQGNDSFSGCWELVQKMEDGKLVYKTAAKTGTSPEASIISSDNGLTYDFIEDNQGLYWYAINDIQMGSNSTKYDALIKVDASSYQDNGDDDNIDGNLIDALEYNSQKVPNISDFDLNTEAFYVQSTMQDAEAAAYFKAKYIELGYSNADLKDFMNRLSRTIKVEITNKSVSFYEADQTMVRVYYTYKCTGINAELNNVVFNTKYDIFDNTKTKMALKTVYLFYQPVYTSKAASSVKKDTIIIENKNNLKLDLFVVKQENVAKSELKLKESTYGMDFQVSEGSLNTDGNAFTTVHTNLGTNLYIYYDPAMTGANPAQANYSYQAGNIPQPIDKLKIKTLADEESKDRLFDVEVRIYKSDGYDKGFPEDSRLKTIEGSQIY